MQGALRLAAHKILGERPHFGGKYSEEVIEQGIKLLEELNRPSLSRRSSLLTASGPRCPRTLETLFKKLWKKPASSSFRRTAAGQGSG